MYLAMAVHRHILARSGVEFLDDLRNIVFVIGTTGKPSFQEPLAGHIAVWIVVTKVCLDSDVLVAM